MVSPLSSQCPFLLGGPGTQLTARRAGPPLLAGLGAAQAAARLETPPRGPCRAWTPPGSSRPALCSCWGCGRLSVPATAGACVGTLPKYALSWQLHTCCVSGQHTQARASRSENKTVCEMAEKADTCMEMMSALQALTLPSQGELKSLNQTVREGSVPSDSSTHPAFCRSPQQPPVNQCPFHMPAGDTLAGGEQRCCQTGGAELGVPPGLHGTDPQPECRRPACPISSPLAPVPLDEAPLRMSKSPSDKRPLFAPCPALHRHFAKHSFGFGGLHSGPSP